MAACTMSPRQVVLPADTTAPRAAREFLAEACCGSHVSAVVEEAQLLVSELVTNAVRYGAPPIELQVRCAGDNCLRVRVRDSEPGTPEPRTPDPDAESGRGLLLVDLVSDAWGSEYDEDGKAIWFTLKG
ncbi:MAG TPA: ATP-binding protein [Sporichthya sp.]|nr:ATP-binding protein [Sporichthya sp.]